MSRSHHRRRYPSKSSPRKDEAPPSFSQDCQRLERLLENLPFCSSLKVVDKIGEGTFSKVYLVKDGEDRKLAIKHLVPTASPDRILMEVECLKSAEGKENVLQLLFVHRLLGNVIFAMPYIECSKFSEVIKTLDHVEARLYMKNLLMAVAHIHQLGIIHRDIKPANFLYDRKRKIFRLVDFGLAQKTDSDGGQVKEGSVLVKEPSSRPSCKRKLTSSDLANSMESPPCQNSKKRKLNHPSGERGASRKVLSDKTAVNLNMQNMISPSSKNTTPRKKTHELTMVEDDEINDFYDRRGAILSARKRTRSSARQKRPQLSDEIDHDPGEETETQVCVQEPKTPIKNMATLLGTPEVRRSPRKHPSSSKPPGFSKLTISGSAIMSADKTNKLKRQGSFTMLDPASGVPSDGTPRLQASLTSRHSALLLPGQFHFSLSSANLHASSLIMGHHPLRDSPLTLPARFATPPLRKTACQCFGRPRVCTRCLSKRNQRAARAGTPGFRPPEVLLKFEHQTTAVDIWATGVILLSILSRTYPFFRAPDDHTALAELVAMFGTRAVQEAADQYGKRFICSEQVEPVDLQVLCQRLGERRDIKSPEMASTQCLSTDLAADLLKKMLSLSSHERCTAQAALEHAFFEN